MYCIFWISSTTLSRISADQGCQLKLSIAQKSREGKYVPITVILVTGEYARRALFVSSIHEVSGRSQVFHLCV